jgi:hypothetical protein
LGTPKRLYLPGQRIVQSHLHVPIVDELKVRDNDTLADASVTPCMPPIFTGALVGTTLGSPAVQCKPPSPFPRSRGFT